MDLNEKSEIAAVVLRIGIAMVFLVFGIGKLRQDIWFHTIKSMKIFSFLGGGIDAFIYLIGLTEIAIAAFLIIGLHTRLFASLAAIEIAMILFLLKFAQVRDIAILAAAVSLAMLGSRKFSLDAERKWSRR